MQRRMAAGKDQPKAIVRERRWVSFIHVYCRLVRCGRFVEQRLLFFAPRTLAPAMVPQFAVRDGGNPRSRIFRYPPGGPVCDGSGECLLHRLLGQIERAGDSDERGDNAPRLRPKNRLDRTANVIHCFGWPPAWLPLLPGWSESPGWHVSPHSPAIRRTRSVFAKPRLSLHPGLCSSEGSSRQAAP